MSHGISIVSDRLAAMSKSTISYHRRPEPTVRSSPQ